MSRKSKTVGERDHLERVAGAGCVICALRLDRGWVQCHVHHLGEGSQPTSDFGTVGLCEEHHDPNKTGSGFHGMGARTFCRIFRVPGEREEGLLVMENELLAKRRRYMEEA